MSRAFVKEPDGGDVAIDLPERPVSSHRNFVTATGLAQIDAQIVHFRDALGKAQAGGGKQAVATASRDIRYWTARRASAELVEASAGREVRFGSTVTIQRADGRLQTFRITGEDEAEPAQGTLSYVAPLARAMIGREEGDEIEFQDETIVLGAVVQS